MKVGPWNDSSLRWVCENHPKKDQSHRLWFGFGPECGGAGMPDPKSKWAMQDEIDRMIARYREEYPHVATPFLVGSSLMYPPNKHGDSARFWELKKILDA